MNNVDTITDAVAEMRKHAQPVVDLSMGGAHMRSKGEVYLPKFPMEDKESYDARKESSWLFDGVGKAVEDYVARLFDKPISCEDEGQLADWCENVDLEGRDLSNFAQDAFKAAVKSGLSFIMADAPPRDGEVTRGQAQAQNLRPYLTALSIFDVLGWKIGYENNAPQLTQFRIMESVTVPDGEFGEKKIDQVRVLDLVEGRVQVRLFQKLEGKSWTQIGETIQTDQTEIMVAPVYTGRTGFFMAKPPLERLAEINLAHWRSQSDQANIMHHARAPIKWFTGWNPDDLKNSAESPGYAFVTSNPDAATGVLEHGGTAIEAGRQELKDLEQQMQWTGLQLVMSKANGTTATGDKIDEKKNTSSLAMWADNLKDALEIALGWMAELGAIDADTGVTMSRDFLSISMDETSLQVLQQIGTSQETLLREAKRRGVLSEDVDVADEMERIQQEGALSLGAFGDG